MSKRYYIAGPMRGHPDLNWPAFDECETHLCAAGYEVISPANHDRANGIDPENFTDEQRIAAMKWDLEQILHWRTDGVVAIPGWQSSEGALAELEVAHLTGKETLFYDPETTLLRPLTPAEAPQNPPEARVFPSGAMRDTDEGKFDYEGFLSPLVLVAFGQYMHKHRQLKDGSIRASDNWQAGIPREELMKSLLRHVMDLWLLHRGVSGPLAGIAQGKEPVIIEDALGGIFFNTQAYWLDLIDQ